MSDKEPLLATIKGLSFESIRSYLKPSKSYKEVFVDRSAFKQNGVKGAPFVEKVVKEVDNCFEGVKIGEGFVFKGKVDPITKKKRENDIIWKLAIINVAYNLMLDEIVSEYYKKVQRKERAAELRAWMIQHLRQKRSESGISEYELAQIEMNKQLLARIADEMSKLRSDYHKKLDGFTIQLDVLKEQLFQCNEKLKAVDKRIEAASQELSGSLKENKEFMDHLSDNNIEVDDFIKEYAKKVESREKVKAKKKIKIHKCEAQIKKLQEQRKEKIHAAAVQAKPPAQNQPHIVRGYGAVRVSQAEDKEISALQAIVASLGKELSAVEMQANNDVNDALTVLGGQCVEGAVLEQVQVECGESLEQCLAERVDVLKDKVIIKYNCENLKNDAATCKKQHAEATENFVDMHNDLAENVIGVHAPIVVPTVIERELEDRLDTGINELNSLFGDLGDLEEEIVSAPAISARQ